MKEKLQEIDAIKQDRNSPNDKFLCVLKHSPCNPSEPKNTIDSKVKKSLEFANSVDDIQHMACIQGRERDSLRGSGDISLKSGDDRGIVNGSHAILHTSSTKLGPKVTLWIGTDLHSIAAEYKLNLSALLREKIKEHLRSKNIEIKEDCPQLILEVKCPFCSNKQKTTTVKTVRCFKCNKQYRVMGRGKSRIVSIIKGNIGLVHKLYYSVYPKRRAF